MAKASIGKKLSNFTIPATGEKDISLADLKGKNVVLYFYPKDSTPGCTREGQDFTDNIRKFRARNTVILGVSRDSIKSHENFKAKQKYSFEVASTCGLVKTSVLNGESFWQVLVKYLRGVALTSGCQRTYVSSQNNAKNIRDRDS